MVRELREAAERAVDALADALALNGLPPLVGLEGCLITLLPHGAHVQLGGCNVRTVQALADFLKAHARCSGRVLSGTVVPSGLAELPAVRRELRT